MIANFKPDHFKVHICKKYNELYREIEPNKLIKNVSVGKCKMCNVHRLRMNTILFC